ncbi:carbon storage regulator [Xanthobacter sp. 126]|uniref:carbon storage regulator n=1 Tax=Xanthobacter TaxID=279 RepID=UPI00045E9D2F|nr:carbon storage regulator [Xanthobacter sp. 126]
MLMTNLYLGDSIVVGDVTIVLVGRTSGGAGQHARIGITAPKDMKIEHRAGRGSGARASFSLADGAQDAPRRAFPQR